jgi:hypothetical protein
MARASSLRDSRKPAALNMAVSLPAGTPLKVGIAGEQPLRAAGLQSQARRSSPRGRGRPRAPCTGGRHFGRDLRVRVVGATGAVGKEIVGVLEKRGSVLCPSPLSCVVPPCGPAAIKMRTCVCMLDACVRVFASRGNSCMRGMYAR